MGSWIALGMAAALAAAPVAARAQADVGLVNLASGDVIFVPQIGPPGKARSFMKVREGDRFEIPAGGQLRLVYFEGARHERWQGPARLRAARKESAAESGRPAEVHQLPGSVPQRMARVPDLLQHARLGGVQVRSAGLPRKGNEAALDEARATYRTLRRELPADDITAELFLFSALNDSQRYDEMAPLVDEMLRKQPQSEEVRALASWLKARRGG